ncbi:hypothetical protein CF15_05955 [Pyrodictium occultum]|uniref:Uncharacterized protein n=2 Tax=Pyrodictium occultum TaxID=2309 RepID=A0A0V8RWD2_PYROC|nr:hypothetical protein CF15_05955 [Pyrodictium occultum]
MCTSPKLSRPTAAVTSPSRCQGSEAEYRACQFYVDPDKGQRRRTGLEAGLRPAIADQLKPYPPIHLLTSRPQQRCPFMRVYEYSGGYLAQCRVLNRLLTRSEAEKCEKYWQSCPFYKVGVQQKAAEA